MEMEMEMEKLLLIRSSIIWKKTWQFSIENN